MTLWNDIVTCALTGTQLQGGVRLSSDGALAGALDGIDSPDPESALLSSAAMMGFYQKAGEKPSPMCGISPPKPPLEESLPPCPERAASLLCDVLRESPEELLLGWLRRAKESRCLVPPGMLPELLETCKRTIRLREAAIPVIGQRGQWLARLNPDWGVFQKLEADTTDWTEGNLAARKSYLAELRGRDAAAGRELLAQVWGSEPARERAELLGALEAGLSAADEEFLEKALDDRSKDARLKAVDLLARLPGSALVSRMKERALQLFSIERKGLLGGKKLEVRLPETLDEPTRRDGLRDKVAIPYGMGEKAWWLCHILGCVPPSAWSAHYELSPEKLLELAGKNDFAPSFVFGWARATERSGDQEWALALLRYCDGKSEYASLRESLLQTLPADQRQAAIIELAKTQKKLDALFPLLDSLPECWGEALTLAILAELRSRKAAKLGLGDFQVRALVGVLALWGAPVLFPKLEKLVDEMVSKDDLPGSNLATQLQIYRLRYDIEQAFGQATV